MKSAFEQNIRVKGSPSGGAVEQSETEGDHAAGKAKSDTAPKNYQTRVADANGIFSGKVFGTDESLAAFGESYRNAVEKGTKNDIIPPEKLYSVLNRGRVSDSCC